MDELQKEGFLVIKNFIALNMVNWHLDNIKAKIAKSSFELGVSVSDYLNCTGRWGGSSGITKNISAALNNIIQYKLEELMRCQVQLKKSNIICKTADLIDAVPFHQDISYNPNDPYHFSVWLALNEVGAASGALRVIKNSHTWKIKPAADFWSPFFVDEYSGQSGHKQVTALPVSTGDAIVFDSRLWHGSGQNLDAKDRFAYVTRWVIKDGSFPVIPELKPLIFGMFNCSLLTERILKEYLSSIDKYYGITEQDKTGLIKAWLSYLKNATALNLPEINVTEAHKDLSKLLILDNASMLHDAGDISGKIYKNLWFSLLRFLNTKTRVVKV